MKYGNLLRRLCDDNNIDGWIEEDGDNGGEVFVLFDSWDAAKELNNLLKAYFYMLGVDTSDVNERSDTGYLDFATDDEWLTAEDGFTCDDCGKFYRNDGFYQNYYIFDEGGISCEDCIHNNDGTKNAYIDSLVNDYQRCNTILSDSDLEEAGFELYSGNHANGWYGRNDSPKQILDSILDECPDAEVVFSVRKTYNPWETRFDVFVRGFEECGYDEDDEDEDDI